MIANKIRLARSAKGFTQETMAEALQMSQSAYSKIESEKTKIKFELLQEIAFNLKLTTAELLSFGEKDLLLSKIAIIENQLSKLQNIVKEQQSFIQKLLIQK